MVDTMSVKLALLVLFQPKMDHLSAVSVLLALSPVMAVWRAQHVPPIAMQNNQGVRRVRLVLA